MSERRPAPATDAPATDATPPTTTPSATTPDGAEVPELDALDAATLTTLLRTGPHGRPDLDVGAVTAEPLGVATGFLGRLRRLTLQHRGAPGPDRLVAKAPTEDPGGRAVGRMLDVWAREHRFYAELAPAFGAVVPACHANLGDPRRDRWLLLLEDAGDSVAPSQSAGAGADQAGVALDAIAAVHRGTLGARPAAWLPGFDRGPLDALQAAVRAAVEPFLARFGELLPPGGPDLLRRFAPRLATWAHDRSREPLVLAHADYRLDNLVIGPTGRVVVLDWQTALMGPGEMDVASFLATSLTVADRRAHEHGLIARYAAATGRTTAQVTLGVRHHLLWWMALYANNLSRIEPGDPAGAAMFEHTVRRTFEAAVDHEVGALVPQ